MFLPAIVALTGAGQVAPAVAGWDTAGVVYTETNAVTGNEIVVFDRARDGTLTAAGRVATEGLGTGGGLGNQAALALTKNGRWLFAVNAGSNEISVFAARSSRLKLVDKTSSGGERPVSLTVHDDVLYVLNAGGVNNITGFTIGEWGKLTPIANSTKPLSAAATGPAQVQFDPSGETLVVTEKATNKIDLYSVEDGVATGPLVRDSNGMTPFGFAFDRRGHLIVSEAFGGAPNKSALSSYDIDEDDGALDLISGSIGSSQTAACWVVVTRNNRYAYTTNTGSGTVSGYRINRSGMLSLLNADGRTAVIGAGSAPTDAALTKNSRFLYVLNSAIGTVSGFRVERNGSLWPVDTQGGLPAGVTGLVAR
jgi:6-phosphogluconolactonase (cycloisomerase 2 family)